MTDMTELFLDNNMIEVTPGVSRKLHQPKKHLLNPIIRADRWWEGYGLQPYSTMYDKEDKLFKMWARCCYIDPKSPHSGGHAAYTSYLTSTDGVHWDKPEPGVLDIAGRRDHSVIFTDFDADTKSVIGKRGFIEPVDLSLQGKKGFIWTVVKHPNPGNEGEKFVGLAFLMKRRGAHIVTSPDGIHWSCGNLPFWQTPHDVSGKGDDALMHLIYDKAKHKWVIYRRIIPEFSERMLATENDRYRKGIDRYNRSYGYAESEDLKVWKNHKFILSMDADDPADTELYQFNCHAYGHIYVGYMNIYYLRAPEPINIHLATSRDGINFTRVCRGVPFIPNGPLGYYDFMVRGDSQAEPIIVDDTIHIYYMGGNLGHGMKHEWSISLATLKRDRFASLETGNLHPGPCRVITKPFTVQHSRLFLNAATWEKGSIRVEALTRDWHPVEGFTEPQALDIRGDALDFPVKWKDNTDISKLLGKEIRLKFYMTRARLYAMTLSDEERKLCPVDREDRYDRFGDSSPKLI